MKFVLSPFSLSLDCIGDPFFLQHFIYYCCIEKGRILKLGNIALSVGSLFIAIICTEKKSKVMPGPERTQNKNAFPKCDH